MQIQILTSGVQTKTNKQGKPYQALEVNYKNLTFNKVESKILFSFGAQMDAYKTLADSKSGEVFEVEVVKNTQGYNDWVKVTQAAPGAAQAAVAQGTINGAGKTVQVKSTYETPEERALKQVYIIRQSSITAAINSMSVGAKSALATDAVLKQAQEYFNWVMQNDLASAKQDVMSLPNDIDVE